MRPGAFARFLLPSVIGAVAFLLPVRDGETVTIPMAILSSRLTALLGDALPAIVVVIVAISAVLSVWFSIFSRDRAASGRINSLFSVTPGWLALRVAGLIVSLAIIFEIGPEFVWSENTGHVVLYELVTAILSIFVFASFLLPLLTEYGLMELVGTLLSRPFQLAFRLPGRSCIDALASWMAASSVGVLITSQQYESGNYSGREASVIATNFSVVSLPFCLIVAQFVGLSHLFVEYYLTVVVAGLIAAIVTPRIPPLSRIPDTYSEVGRQLHEDHKRGESAWKAGFNAAIRKAEASPGPKGLLRTASFNLFDIWFGLMPPLIAIATAGLAVANYTPIFTWLSYPIIPVLELFRLPDAAAAAPALLVGFAEMFLPAILVQEVESEITRFVVIVVSITQLIFMSEMGVLILKTRIPLNLVNLITVFLIRTAITLPVAVASAYWLVF